jgi:hypothetical protein
VTDGPQNAWQEVSVILKAVQVFDPMANDWEDVWTAAPNDPGTGKINLVTLAGVSMVLGQADIPVGTYDRIKIVIDTNPATMTLVDRDGQAVLPGDIIVTDAGGTGEIEVALEPAVSVAEGGLENVQLDFDLAHPLSVVRVDDKVVLNIQVRRKAVPSLVTEILFTRMLGEVTAAATDGSSFTLTSLQGAEFVLRLDAGTNYWNADANQAGSFAGLAALANRGAALVALEMQADRSYRARRVWYAAAAATLADFTPEGLIRNLGPDWLTVSKLVVEEPSEGHYQSGYSTEAIFVDPATVWTFKGRAMGQGTGLVGQLGDGYRVEILLVDPTASPRVAESINVTSAAEDGIVTQVTATGFALGEAISFDLQTYSAILGHEFEWWFYDLEAAKSASVQAFIDTADKAALAGFRLSGIATLVWDDLHARWLVEDFVLNPVRLHDATRITTAYSAAAGTMVLATYDCWDSVTPQDLTVFLDTDGAFRTMIGSLVVNGATSAVTYAFPVPVADWESLLVPSLTTVRAWLRPDVGSDGALTWHAYAVLAKRTI